MELNPDRKRKFDEILKRYPVKRSAILPLLHLLQEQEGWLSTEALEYAASLLELTPAQVHDAATYYTMYRFKPEGRHHLEFCTNLSCALYGADELIAETCRRLGVKEGETTADGNFTVHRVECLAACGGGPAVQVDGRWVENVTPADLEQVLSGKLTRRPFVWPKSPGEVVILRNVWKENSASIDVYKAGGGYAKLKDFLSMKPEDIIETVKKANLRGRGGAGFPTGMKWSFLPKDSPKPRYLLVNADESEPGTFKDRLIIENDPHQLIEASVVSAHAIRSKVCYIYIRGEFHEGIQILEKAVAEAYAAGYAGKDILGTGVDVDVVVHGGAGAYECGEETALLESLEGKRGQPRLKPPFPATSGLYNCPTIVNNVESISSVPYIIGHGAPAFAAFGTEKSKGFGIFSLSGHVTTPGQYEAPLGTTLRELLDLAGGIRAGHRLKFWTPGGSSTPLFTHEHLDVPLDFEAVAAADSMLGTRALQIFDETTCVVRATLRWMEFYEHESCGKCTPCREGTYWIVQLLHSLERGEGSDADLDKLLDICDNILG